jgi:hypothetical protein
MSDHTYHKCSSVVQPCVHVHRLTPSPRLLAPQNAWLAGADDKFQSTHAFCIADPNLVSGTSWGKGFKSLKPMFEYLPDLAT